MNVCVLCEVVAPQNYDNKVDFHLRQTKYTDGLHISSLGKIRHCL